MLLYTTTYKIWMKCIIDWNFSYGFFFPLQVFKEEEEAIKVDLHEGCGRTKLFWVMSLADSRTLKAMVEFREGTRGIVERINSKDHILKSLKNC